MEDEIKLDKEFLKEMDETLRKKGLTGGFDYNAPKNDLYFRDVVTPAILTAIDSVFDEYTFPKPGKPGMSGDQLEKVMTTIVYTIFKNYSSALPERFVNKMLSNMIASHCAKLLRMVDKK